MSYKDPHSDKQVSDILSKVSTVALVGASNKEGRASYRVMHFLQNKGFRVIPVSPRLAGDYLLGEKVYGSLEAIPEKIDMVDLFVNSERVTPIIDSAIVLKPAVIWMQIGVINHAAADKVQQAGIDVVMDRCPKKEIARLNLFVTEKP